MNKRQQGSYGENLAAEYIKKLGYYIISKNFHSRYGEIDIIAIEDKTLVFIEVKMRKSWQYGAPEEAVTPQKIRSIIKVGQYFKLLNPETPDLLRIDVVAIDSPNPPKIRLIKNVTG